MEVSRRQPIGSTRLNPSKVCTRGIACPFAKSDPDRYRDKTCRPIQGFDSQARMLEHVWRTHSLMHGCEWCGKRWTAVPRREVLEKKEAHKRTCQQYPQGQGELVHEKKVEWLNQDQQQLLNRVSKQSSGDPKFIAIYEACGKPIPEDSWHVDLPSYTQVGQSANGDPGPSASGMHFPAYAEPIQPQSGDSGSCIPSLEDLLGFWETHRGCDGPR